MIKASDCASSVARVESCPRTKEEWKAASERKKCYINKYAKPCYSHNCKYEYHCVLNEWINETVEVCAIKKLIICKNFN